MRGFATGVGSKADDRRAGPGHPRECGPVSQGTQTIGGAASVPARNLATGAARAATLAAHHETRTQAGAWGP